MQDRARKQNRFLIAIVVAALLVGALMAIPGSAEHANHGTIKVHDDPDTEPEERNVPHVWCDFWIAGMNMSHENGTLVFYSWPPTGDRSIVLEANWTGEEEEDGEGFSFMAGPFTLDPGHYRVEAYVDDGHPGGHGHFAKAKTFWVDCEEGQEEPTPPRECPPLDLQGEANQDGSITLDWTSDPESDGTNLYRAVEDGAFEYIATFEPGNDTYTDTDTEIGTTYTYTVTALYGDRESEPCPEVEVTAIPVFPTLMALGLATAAGVAGYARMRRRA